MRYGSVCSGIEAEKQCASCGETKPLTGFHKQGERGTHSYCKECFNARYRGVRRRKTDRAAKRAQNFKARYDLTEAEIDSLIEKQGGVCAICKRDVPNLVVDHDHATGAVRGILCHPCNIKLPAVEDPAFLASALSYLGRDQ